MFPKRVVSFSLYGNIPLYTTGAIENAELVHSIYPGWTARFYVDDTVSPDILSALTTRGAEVVHVSAPSLGPHYGRCWRAWIAAEQGVERFIVRDTDSRLNTREKAAVDAWMSSNKTFHLMRDSRFHTSRVLGGMWGGLGGTIPAIRTLTDTWGKYSRQGHNDQFMSESVFPLMRDDYICHDSYGHFDDGQPFPPHPPMQGTSFVGEIVTEQIRQQDAWRMLAEYKEETARAVAQLTEAQKLNARYFQLVHKLETPDAPVSCESLCRWLASSADVRRVSGILPPINTFASAAKASSDLIQFGLGAQRERFPRSDDQQDGRRHRRQRQRR